MSITIILFIFLSALAILAAGAVVASKNPVHSVLWLIVVFFAISGHYIMLNAQFLAVVNLIVYAGAIMVLFLFVVMLMNLNADSEPPRRNNMFVASLIAGLSLMLVIVAALRQSDQVMQQQQLSGAGEDGLIKVLGRTLFSEYVVPFEISSVLFLSAMIGAVVISKKEEQ
jgi:NADH-quinone oxidoreductase subunit J